MVKGIDTFKKYFNDYSDNYVIIGGTACDMIIDEAGFNPRATKDIDIILIVEAMTKEFVMQFWKFIQDGNYERNEKSSDERKYYRFTKPAEKDFPYQVELFSRKPDVVDLEEPAHLTPIPADDDLSSLSAILLSDDYYNYMVEHSTLENGIRRSNTEALICLKAKAFLEITERIANGSTEDAKHIKKHKADVFRLAVLLAEADSFDLPEAIQHHMHSFAAAATSDLPPKEIFENMGMRNINAENVLQQLKKNFKLE